MADNPERPVLADNQDRPAFRSGLARSSAKPRSIPATVSKCETADEEAPEKQRLSVYLDPDVMKNLADYAARRDHSRSLIAEAAIASFLSPDAAERQEAATTNRFDQLDHRMTRMERDLGIAVETLVVVVRF